MIWLNELIVLLEKIFGTDYNSFFNNDSQLNRKYKRGHNELERFLKHNEVSVQDENVILRYLVSRLIDELCNQLDKFVFSDFENHIDINDDAFKAAFNILKDYANSTHLQNAINKYELFYLANHKGIASFVQQVSIDNPISYFSLMAASSPKGLSYNPYLNLKELLSSFGTKLNSIIKRLKTAN